MIPGAAAVERSGRLSEGDEWSIAERTDPVRRVAMARELNVIDADGHVLEPVDMFEKYMDPAYRDRAPRMIVDTDGKERLLIEGKILGSPNGLAALAGVGARQGTSDDATMKYGEGRK